MPKPNLRAVDSEQPHARDLARQAVKNWKSEADEQLWPIKVHDDKGAPVLDVNATLAHDHHDRRLGRK